MTVTNPRFHGLDEIQFEDQVGEEDGRGERSAKYPTRIVVVVALVVESVRIIAAAANAYDYAHVLRDFDNLFPCA